MDASKLIQQLEMNTERFRALVAGISDEQARWRPDEQAWSLLEMICHLHDEERLDFRVRIDTILHHPGEEVPPIDPPGWVSEHHYAKRDLQTELEGFIAERQKSIAWLKSLEAPPIRVATPNIPLPFNAKLEKELLPSQEKIVLAIKQATS